MFVTFTYRLRGNARSIPGLRRTLKLHMKMNRDIRIRKRTIPLTGLISRRGVAIARAGGLNMIPALKRGIGAATGVGSVSPDRLARCANTPETTWAGTSRRATERLNECSLG